MRRHCEDCGAWTQHFIRVTGQAVCMACGVIPVRAKAYDYGADTIFRGLEKHIETYGFIPGDKI